MLCECSSVIFNATVMWQSSGPVGYTLLGILLGKPLGCKITCELMETVVRPKCCAVIIVGRLIRRGSRCAV